MSGTFQLSLIVCAVLLTFAYMGDAWAAWDRKRDAQRKSWVRRPIPRLYRFTRRHADGLVIAAVLCCAVMIYGTTQQHDEAMQARAFREARR